MREKGVEARRAVLLNDFVAQWRAVSPEALEAMDRVGGSGWYILGREVERFESALSSTWGIEHAIGVGNGLDAIEIALRASGLHAGDKVLTTPLSAFATTLAVVRCGGVPVFVDTDRSGLLDLGLARAVLSRDRGIRFLLPVHLYGHALDLQTLRELRNEHGTVVIEDCAQAIGARSHGCAVGTVGAAAAVSFYPTKNLGALGDGGAVLTPDPQLAGRARTLRHYGQSSTYVHDELGLNSRLDELHAAVLGDVLLPRLASWTARRAEIARRYREGIGGCHVEVLPVPEGSDSVWHLFPVLAPQGRRDALRSHLRDEGVGSGVHYPTLIPDQEALRREGIGEIHGELDRARSIADREVSLPIHPFLTDEEVERVIGAVVSWKG